MTSSDSLSENLEFILEVLGAIPQSEIPQLVSFPENCLFLRLREGASVQKFSLEDEAFQTIAAQVFEKNILVHLGSVPLQINGKVFNSTVLVYPDKSVVAPYQKIHLFDVDVAGMPPIRESDVFSPGDRPSVVEWQGWSLALSICYDLRFSELYRHYRNLEADVVLVPSAFTVPTGRAHWEILLRARAIESQCYVLASAQGGSHKGQRQTYGHTLAVSPWGDVLFEAGETPQVAVLDLHREKIQSVRRQIPMKAHTRL